MPKPLAGVGGDVFVQADVFVEGDVGEQHVQDVADVHGFTAPVGSDLPRDGVFDVVDVVDK